ncbi:hypothetical protein PENTCL1PPCAC_30112, partial [Pristionchus entomophagus]
VRMSPSLSQTHVVQSATAVHPSQNDASEIATSTVTAESGCSRNNVPSSPNDFSMPDTPFGAIERPEKDHEDAIIVVGLSSPSIDPNVQATRLQFMLNRDHAKSQGSSDEVPRPEFEPDAGNDNDPIDALSQAPARLEQADLERQSASQQPPTHQD